MAEQKLTVVFDGDEKGMKRATKAVKSDFKEVGDSAKRAGDRAKDSTKGVESWTQKVSGMKATTVAAWGAVTVAVGAVAKGVWDVVNAYAESEKVQLKLERSIKNAEGSYAGFDAQVQRLISSQSRLAAVDDELVAQSLARLVDGTGDLTAAQKLLPMAMDVSVATGKDLIDVSVALGKIYNGNTRAAKGLGFQIDSTATSTEILAQIQKQAANQAADYGKSTAAAADRMAISYENVKEAAGEFGVEVLHLDKQMNEIAGTLDEFVDDGAVAGLERYGKVFLNNASFGKLFAKELDGAAESERDVAEATKHTSQITDDATVAKKRYAQAIKDAKTAAEEEIGSELDMLRAQERVTQAQENLTEAVKKHGPKSREARIATLELKQARNDAKTATDLYRDSVKKAKDADARAAAEKRMLEYLKKLKDGWANAADAALGYRSAALDALAAEYGPGNIPGIRPLGSDSKPKPKKKAAGDTFYPTAGGLDITVAEAGHREDLISWDPRYRTANIDRWLEAGAGLGVLQPQAPAQKVVTINVTGSKNDALHNAVAMEAALVSILD